MVVPSASRAARAAVARTTGAARAAHARLTSAKRAGPASTRNVECAQRMRAARRASACVSRAVTPAAPAWPTAAVEPAPARVISCKTPRGSGSSQACAPTTVPSQGGLAASCAGRTAATVPPGPASLASAKRRDATEHVATTAARAQTVRRVRPLASAWRPPPASIPVKARAQAVAPSVERLVARSAATVRRAVSRASAERR